MQSLIRIKKPLQEDTDDKVTYFHTIPTSSLSSYMGYEIMIDGKWVSVKKEMINLPSTFETVRKTFDKN